MAPADPPASLTIRVKVPPGYIDGGSDEFSLGAVEAASSVGALRANIQRCVPSHPAPERQRILYGGRALVDNEQALADALNTRRDPSQTEYVVHLIIRGDGVNPPPGPGPGAAQRWGVSTPPLPPAARVPPRANAGLPQPPPAAPMHLPQAPHLHHAVHPNEMARQIQMQQQLAMQRLAQARRGGAMMAPLAGAPAPVPAGGMGAAVAVPGHAVAHGQQQPQAAAATGTPETGMHVNETGAQRPVADAHLAANEAQASSEVQGDPHEGEGAHAPRAPAPQVHAHPDGGQSYTLANGQRVRIQQRATISIPQLGITGHAMPIELPVQNMLPQLAHLMPPAGLPALPQAVPQPPPGVVGPAQAAPDASIERVREIVAEMRRILDVMRALNNATEEQTRITNLQERAQSLHESMDPLDLTGAAPRDVAIEAGRRSTPPNIQAGPQAQVYQPPLAGRGLAPSVLGQGSGAIFGQNPHLHTPLFTPNVIYRPQQAYTPPQPSNPTDVTCYLLSGPQGPQALLLSPQYGTYTSTLVQTAALSPTSPAQPSQLHGHQGPVGQQILDQLAQAAPGGDPVAAAAAQHVQDAHLRQQQQNGDNPFGPLQPLFNHMWLLFRILIFTYFLLGANMGWRRPLALLLIGLGFWMVRLGLFGDGGLARRWWDGIMQVGPPQGNAQGQMQNAQPPPAADGQQQLPEDEQATASGRQAMPTPEQVAQRLINERNAARNARLNQIREYIRPIERAVVLFLASLWPGIGEAHVRAREQEERRRNEEEVAAARRREEEERQRREEEDKKTKEGEPGKVDGGEGRNAAEVEDEKRVDESGSGGSRSGGGAALSSE